MSESHHHKHSHIQDTEGFQCRGSDLVLQPCNLSNLASVSFSMRAEGESGALGMRGRTLHLTLCQSQNHRFGRVSRARWQSAGEGEGEGGMEADGDRTTERERQREQEGGRLVCELSFQVGDILIAIDGTDVRGQR
eukprot:763571-Hanusia_phi.AAC.3